MAKSWPLLTILAGVALPGCPQQSGPRTGAETHFLRLCTTDEHCGAALSCVCGVCTLPCDSTSACAGAGRSSCVTSAPELELVCGGNPPPRGLCLASCTSRDDCTPIGSHLTCASGFCVADPAHIASCPRLMTDPTTDLAPSECPDVGSPGAKLRTLPGTATDYCVKAHPSCLVAGGSCPLYVMSNTGDTWFDRVDQPERYGAFIIALSYGATDVQDATRAPPRDWAAELPRQLQADYPGLDEERVYMVGWSGGAGAVYRSQCDLSKDIDESPYGTTSDLYSALATLGGCVGCSAEFRPLAPNLHAFMVGGDDSIFTSDGCDESARVLAQINGCSEPAASWRNVAADDPYLRGGDGSGIARSLSFGDCPGGDVLAYRFSDEGHSTSFDVHFEPPVSGYDLAWAFLQGRTKPGGVRGTELVCR